MQKAYLARQYKTIAVVGVVVLIIIGFVFSPLVAVRLFNWSDIIRYSWICWYAWFRLKQTFRTAEASRKGLASGLSVAFKSGAVTGMLVAGLALLSIAVYYYIIIKVWNC